MKEKIILRTEQDLADLGFKVTTLANSKVLCEAPYFWCRSCDLCEHGKHFEKVDRFGNTSSELFGWRLTEKQYRKRNRRYAWYSMICLVLSTSLVFGIHFWKDLLKEDFAYVLLCTGIIAAVFILVLVLYYLYSISSGPKVCYKQKR